MDNQNVFRQIWNITASQGTAVLDEENRFCNCGIQLFLRLKNNNLAARNGSQTNLLGWEISL